MRANLSPRGARMHSGKLGSPLGSSSWPLLHQTDNRFLLSFRPIIFTLDVARTEDRIMERKAPRRKTDRTMQTKRETTTKSFRPRSIDDDRCESHFARRLQGDSQAWLSLILHHLCLARGPVFRSHIWLRTSSKCASSSNRRAYSLPGQLGSGTSADSPTPFRFSAWRKTRWDYASDRAITIVMSSCCSPALNCGLPQRPLGAVDLPEDDNTSEEYRLSVTRRTLRLGAPGFCYSVGIQYQRVSRG